MHAKGDDIVPFWMGEKMFDLANEPKKKYFIDEDKHLVTYDKVLMDHMDKFYNLLIKDIQFNSKETIKMGVADEIYRG